jgi:hypothetical protein
MTLFRWLAQTSTSRSKLDCNRSFHSLTIFSETGSRSAENKPRNSIYRFDAEKKEKHTSSRFSEAERIPC